MNNEKPIEIVDYIPTNMYAQARVWQITGELVDFEYFVWFNKVTRTWDRFGPGSVFRLYEDGHVEVGV